MPMLDNFTQRRTTDWYKNLLFTRRPFIEGAWVRENYGLEFGFLRARLCLALRG